jgi:hypothetical protein
VIEESTIDSNFSATVGGGVFSALPISVTGSTISSNSAPDSGGGMEIHGNVFFANSTVTDNATHGDGGGLAIRDFRRVSRGGVTYLPSTAQLEGSTISGNMADNHGGGIFLDTESSNNTIDFSTIAFNVSNHDSAGEGAGGGVFVQGVLALNHTIVAGNQANSGGALDVAGIINSTYSLIGSGANLLGPLGANGGPTLTHALLLGSQAIDAGDPSAEVGSDGVPRVFGSRIDIGALEAQPMSGALHADFNADFHHNGVDFLQWQRGFSSRTDATFADGDATSDGTVDAYDLAIWEFRYNELPARRSAARLDADAEGVLGGDSAGSTLFSLLLASSIPGPVKHDLPVSKEIETNSNIWESWPRHVSTLNATSKRAVLALEHWQRQPLGSAESVANSIGSPTTLDEFALAVDAVFSRGA